MNRCCALPLPAVFLVLFAALGSTGHTCARAQTPSWITYGGDTGVSLGWSVTTAGDVNGDGYSDIIVGCHGCDDGYQTGEGMAYVYLGGAYGLAETPSWTGEGNQEMANYGIAVSTAGDVNGDGYDDVIVGAWGYTDGELREGAAFVYLGSEDGLAESPCWTQQSNNEDARFGHAVSSAGDVNGDGYDDIIIGAHYYSNGDTREGAAFVYLGSPSGPSSTAAWIVEGNQYAAYLGKAVSAAGDVNADGYADVIVGVPGYYGGQSNEGQARVYLGSASGLASTYVWSAESNQVDSRFGSAVSEAGDVNADGYCDVIVGARMYDYGEIDEGLVMVYHGTSYGLQSTAAWYKDGNQAGARFGSAVSTAGDINGDGYADVIIGAPAYDNGENDEGKVWIYFGSPDGLRFNASWTQEGNSTTAWFGAAVSGAGDVNGDGLTDVIIGAPYYDGTYADEGAAYVYHGYTGPLSWLPLWTQEGGAIEDRFGTSVASAGDVNGDGFDDVIIGASGYDNGQESEGGAFAYYGSPTGLSPVVNWTAESDQMGAYFGIATSTAGDVNGDGFSDVLVGAVWYDGGHTDEGKAYLYRGSAGGLAATPAWTAEGESEDAWFGMRLSEAGDVNGDGFGDVIICAPLYSNGHQYEGAAFVYLGSETGLGSSPAWTAEGNQTFAYFGIGVSTAGDVNGDGFSDIIVGASLYDGSLPDEGAAFVYHGSSSGLSSTPDWIATGDQAYCDFGGSVATAGDVNADGFSDVIIGARAYDGTYDLEGQARVYLGSASGLATEPQWVVNGGQEGCQFGQSVACVGDVNLDGYSDCVIGASWYDGGEGNEGAVFLYFGIWYGLQTSSWWSVQGGQTSAWLGACVAGAGDVNGDGYSDAIFGAEGYDGTYPDVGRAQFHYGNCNYDHPAVVINPRQIRLDRSPIDLLGSTGSEPAFRLHARGRSSIGRARVRLEWKVAELSTPLEGTPLHYGDWLDTGTPQGSVGSYVGFDEQIDGLTAGTDYHWKLRIAGNSPLMPRTPWMTITPSVPTLKQLRTGEGGSAVEESPDRAPSTGPRIHAIHPNPVIGRTAVRYVLPDAGPIKLQLLDVSGRLVRTIVDDTRSRGTHTAAWDGKDRDGITLSAGVYLLRLETAQGTTARKVTIAR